MGVNMEEGKKYTVVSLIGSLILLFALLYFFITYSLVVAGNTTTARILLLGSNISFFVAAVLFTLIVGFTAQVLGKRLALRLLQETVGNTFQVEEIGDGLVVIRYKGMRVKVRCMDTITRNDTITIIKMEKIGRSTILTGEKAA